MYLWTSDRNLFTANRSNFPLLCIVCHFCVTVRCSSTFNKVLKMLITGVYNYFKIICNKCKPISENENYPTLVTVSSSITYIQKAFLSQPDIFCHVNCISCHFKNVFLNGVAMLNSLLGQEMPIMRDITKTVQYMYGLCPSLNGRPSPLALLPRLPHSTSCRVDVTAEPRCSPNNFSRASPVSHYWLLRTVDIYPRKTRVKTWPGLSRYDATFTSTNNSLPLLPICRPLLFLDNLYSGN